MAVVTENGVTTLTPTRWKWFTGAAVLFFLIPPFGTVLALIFALTGAGVLQRISLSKEGLTVRNWLSTKTYAWDEIGDFRIQKVKSGVFTAANMVAFTHANKEGTMMGRAAKLLVGGTHSIPAVGVKPQKLIQIMQAYQGGFVPKKSAALEPAQETAAPLPPIASKPNPKPVQRPRAVPATPRAQQKTASKPANFGGKRKTSKPLVQDGGGLFGRRRPSSPFQS